MKFIKTELVRATPMTRGDYNKHRGWIIPADENPNDEGYLVVGSEGYQSWSPKDRFEVFSRSINDMSFGMAIEAMKLGKKVARRGWNGKGMFLWLKPATTIKAEWCKDEMLKGLVEANGGEILGLGTICMYTHDSSERKLYSNEPPGRKAILTGWIPSQSDMLYDDWVIVE